VTPVTVYKFGRRHNTPDPTATGTSTLTVILTLQPQSIAITDIKAT